jgi:hypothetical protein
MRRLRERLIAGQEHATAEINAAVERAIAYFADAQIREFVPLLAERLVRADLGRLGQRR